MGFAATIAGVSTIGNTIDPASANSVHEALAAYLAAREDLRSACIVEPPAPLGSGFDSVIYTFRVGGEVPDARWSAPLVLRLQGNPAAVSKVRREADIQTFLIDAGYPVPALLATEGADNPFGLPFMIMERVPGGTLLARVMSNPLRAGGLLARLAGVHADLHRLPPAGWPLEDGDQPLALRQITQFRRRIGEHGLDVLSDGLAWLERNVPAVLPETAVITHNDFHPLNVLVTDQGQLSVIDWSDAALGDRHHDVARTLTLFSFAYIAASSSVERVVLKAARGYLRSRYFNAYERTFPVDRRRLAYFEALQSFHGLLQVSELGLPTNRAQAATEAASGLPSNLIEEIRVYVRRRMADAERVLNAAPG